ncbi:MAG: uridine diphosphate-N-acetylglucosamine-binding protein YvcK [Actinomycetota bacterium]
MTSIESPQPDDIGLVPDGPSVVALGGGHGLAASLQAARSYASTLTGVVSVGDDGGSSGRLRTEFGITPPGDVRRCISALVVEPTLLSQALEYRFTDGELKDHPIGNLLLTGLAMVAGDFEEAVDELCRLVGVADTIVPAASIPLRLLADSDRGRIEGEVTIEKATGIRNLRFEPAEPPVPSRAVEAVVEADQVIVGPGSLFTSVLASAVVPGILDAVDKSEAQRVYVANVANDKAEARGFGLAAHLEALAQHGVTVDVVVAPTTLPDEPIEGVEVVWADVAADDGWGHDPAKLGPVLAAAYRRR